MDILSLQFLSALMAIVVIDLVLAGDNAIVIALATRKLPDHMRRTAILWGTVGAVVVRSAMTAGVVWLLKIPGLMLAGGVLLVWIAYKLLADHADDEQEPELADGFWAAIKTIVIADMVMGLDNVLAVAGAAHGSFLLVVLGLLISIPIVVWGSQLILKMVDRFQFIIYIGAGVLAWTSAKMIISEPLVVPFMKANPIVPWLLYALIIGGVLGLGYLANRTADEDAPAVEPAEGTMSFDAAGHVLASSGLAGNSEAAGAELASDASSTNAPATNSTENFAVAKILVPLDGSTDALNAVRHAVTMAASRAGLEAHLVYVRQPSGTLFKRDEQPSWNASEAERALVDARALLDEHGVAHAEHVERGEAAAVIDRVARRIKAEQIVMGAAPASLLARLSGRSLASAVVAVSSVPVQVVSGGRVSTLTR